MCDGVIVAELSVIRVLLSFYLFLFLFFVCAADSAENVTYVGRLGI